MLYEPTKIKDITIKNKIVMSSMCMYSASDGFPTDWHKIHYGSRAAGGAGLIMSEAAAVEPIGRISPYDLGLWKDEHIGVLKDLVDICHDFGSKVGVQLAHAGRKAESYGPWERRGAEIKGSTEAIAPSAIPFGQNWHTPNEMSVDDIENVKTSFLNAVKRAVKVGFDIIEIHAAHGYLLHQFLSPISNVREDSYGGSFENRQRLLLEIVKEAKNLIPNSTPLFVRLSCVDYVEGGITIKDTVKIAKNLKDLGVDVVDCSSGGIVEEETKEEFPCFQCGFAEKIKSEAGVMTMAVGAITEYDQAENILKNKQADLVAFGRKFLRNPYFPTQWAKEKGIDFEVPLQYKRGWM